MRELLFDVLDGFRAQKARTGFCLLAIAVGATTLAVLVAILTSLEATSRRLVSELGADAIVALAEPDDANAGRLDQSTAGLLRANFQDLTVATVRRTEARTLGSSEKLQVIGTDSSLAAAREWTVINGRFLDRLDVERAERHAVISQKLALEWGWQVGQVVMLADVPVVVVGVVRTQGTALAGQFGNPDLVFGERLVFVPHTVPPLWSGSGEPDGRVDALFVRLGEGSNPARSLRAVQAVLAAPGLSVGQISWITPETLVERIDRLKTVIGGSVAVVSLLCLILGGTTLMSLMVSNIRERVAEIGLRLTLGATRSEIAALFVSESLLLSLVGALAGVLLGHLLIAFVTPLLPIQLVTGSLSWGVPVATSVLFGLLFTYGPAIRASRIAPAAALRAE